MPAWLKEANEILEVLSPLLSSQRCLVRHLNPWVPIVGLVVASAFCLVGSSSLMPLAPTVALFLSLSPNQFLPKFQGRDLFPSLRNRLGYTLIFLLNNFVQSLSGILPHYTPAISFV